MALLRAFRDGRGLQECPGDPAEPRFRPDRRARALLVFRRRDEETEQLATRLAHQAAIAIANSGSFVDSEEANDQLRDALASRDVIGQAKGILMERSDLTADEAFDEMRVASQRANRKLRDVAEDIVTKVRGRKRS